MASESRLFGELAREAASIQALGIAHQYFSKTYLLHAEGPGASMVVFHAKMYLFFGRKKCRFYIGSHDLTVGGTETNWECGVGLDVTLPRDLSIVKQMRDIWNELASVSTKVDPNHSQTWLDSGLLYDESQRQMKHRKEDSSELEHSNAR